MKPYSEAFMHYAPTVISRGVAMADIDWMDLFFQFDGRINRAKFWLGIVIVAVINGIAGSLFRGSSFFIALLIALALVWPGLAVSIKRWHDRDKSGWWVLIALIPFIGWIWALVETGFLEGTKGPNQYGPDPLGGSVADEMGM